MGLPGQPDTELIFITENGPSTDDEINVLLPGANYGWPEVVGVVSKNGFEDPLATFTPNIAPIGMVFYTGNSLPVEYHGNLFLGDWNTESLRRVVLQETSLAQRIEVAIRLEGQGILDVVNGPDGHLYFSTPGTIYRVVVDDTQ